MLEAIHKLCPNMGISDLLTTFLKSSLDLVKHLARYYPEARDADVFVTDDELRY